ncbi:MAG: rhodanese-like domain-containing protein [Ferruginibacter sp.]
MTNISITELKERVDSGENINLVDVREPAEREEFHIGGIFLPLGNILSMQIDLLEELKEEEIICYCRSGKRSMQAAMMLETLGFSNVKNLEGGTLAWKEKYTAG